MGTRDQDEYDYLFKGTFNFFSLTFFKLFLLHLYRKTV